MTSNSQEYNEAFVWIWLPGSASPVVAGKLSKDGGRINFNYGKSYLERQGAISLFEAELPLIAGLQEPKRGLALASCIRDSAPDAWGRRVILNRFGHRGTSIDTAHFNELMYLLESGSDRIGALDFQRSASHYEARSPKNATLQQLQSAVESIEQGQELNNDLSLALQHGTSIGGARPKVLIETKEKKYIAKFSLQSDVYSVVKLEFIAMTLASLVGINTAKVSLEKSMGKDVLLVERFDRQASSAGWLRRSMVSALTLHELDEMMARYASYEIFAEKIRAGFCKPEASLRELFNRMVFNVLCGNTDDHARNHAAFWNGKELELTPAYDICPQVRFGREATQAMLISGDDRRSRLATCLASAHNFHLSQQQAMQVIETLVTAMRAHWDEVCDQAALSRSERKLFWGRQFLNPYAFEGMQIP